MAKFEWQECYPANYAAGRNFVAISDGYLTYCMDGDLSDLSAAMSIASRRLTTARDT